MARKAIHGSGSECGAGALKECFKKKIIIIKLGRSLHWDRTKFSCSLRATHSKKNSELMAMTKEQILSQMSPSCLETLHSSSPPWLSSLPPKKDVKAHQLAFLYLGPCHPFFSLERDHCWHHC